MAITEYLYVIIMDNNLLALFLVVFSVLVLSQKLAIELSD